MKGSSNLKISKNTISFYLKYIVSMIVAGRHLLSPYIHSPLQELIADPKVIRVTERKIYSKNSFSMISNVFIDGLT